PGRLPGGRLGALDLRPRHPRERRPPGGPYRGGRRGGRPDPAAGAGPDRPRVIHPRHLETAGPLAADRVRLAQARGLRRLLGRYLDQGRGRRYFFLPFLCFLHFFFLDSAARFFDFFLHFFLAFGAGWGVWAGGVVTGGTGHWTGQVRGFLPSGAPMPW